MRELREILRENFYSNAGVDNCLANAVTSGQEKIIKHGINPAGKTMLKMTAEITKTSRTSVHVKVKGIRLSKMEFDIDFAEHEDKIRELARGKFSDLKFNWDVDNYSRDKGVFAMRFTNMSTHHDYFLNYNVDSDTLTKW